MRIRRDDLRILGNYSELKGLLDGGRSLTVHRLDLCDSRELKFIRLPATPLARVLAIAILLAIPASEVLHAQISPGPLSKAHESLSGPTQCTSCHVVGKGSAVLKCQECHTEIAAEISSGHGLHATFPNKQDCAKCHSEHNGEDFPLIHWEPSLKAFDHTRTGYALQGKHAQIVWIFAGGEPPTAFLKKIGVGFGMRDVTTEASSEAKQAMSARLGSPVLAGSPLSA